MSGARDDFIEYGHANGEACPQNAQAAPGRHQAYQALDDALVRLSSPGGSQARLRAFEIIREVLEDSGVPFLRANALAEKCYTALGEIL